MKTSSALITVNAPQSSIRDAHTMLLYINRISNSLRLRLLKNILIGLSNPKKRRRCVTDVKDKLEKNFPRLVDKNMLCARNPVDEEGTCPGDSGKLDNKIT